MTGKLLPAAADSRFEGPGNRMLRVKGVAAPSQDLVDQFPLAIAADVHSAQKNNPAHLEVTNEMSSGMG